MYTCMIWACPQNNFHNALCNLLLRHQENLKHAEWDTAYMCANRVVGVSKHDLWSVMVNCLLANLRDIWCVCPSFCATLEIMKKIKTKQHAVRRINNSPLQLQRTQRFVNKCILCIYVSCVSFLWRGVLNEFLGIAWPMRSAHANYHLLPLCFPTWYKSFLLFLPLLLQNNNSDDTNTVNSSVTPTRSKSYH